MCQTLDWAQWLMLVWVRPGTSSATDATSSAGCGPTTECTLFWRMWGSLASKYGAALWGPVTPVLLPRVGWAQGQTVDSTEGKDSGASTHRPCKYKVPASSHAPGDWGVQEEGVIESLQPQRDREGNALNQTRDQSHVQQSLQWP